MSSLLIARNIAIDINPSTSTPYISVYINKLVLGSDGHVQQTIGQFDRITRSLAEISPLPLGDFEITGTLDANDLFKIVAQYVFQWIQAEHGGTITPNGVLVE